MDVLRKLQKSLPDGSFFTLDEVPKPEVISTGITTVDYASGIGGFARSTMNMIWGSPSTGKTAMVLRMIANQQENNPDSVAAIIDLEKSIDLSWAQQFGIDPKRLYIIRPATTEEAITCTCQAILAHTFDIVVVDSLGAGILQSEIDNDKSRMAGSAGNITRFVKAINSAFITLEREKKVAEDKGDSAEDIVIPTVIFINQARANLNAMIANAETWGGGKALGHMCTSIVHLRTSKAAADKVVGTVDGMDMRVGWLCNATFDKQKLATPGKAAGYIFVFQECPEHEFGIDNAQSIADLAITTGLARVEGKTIYYPTKDGEAKVVGRNNFRKLLHDDPDLVDYLSQEITQLLHSNIKDEDLTTINE